MPLPACETHSLSPAPLQYNEAATARLLLLSEVAAHRHASNQPPHHTLAPTPLVIMNDASTPFPHITSTAAITRTPLALDALPARLRARYGAPYSCTSNRRR